MSENNIEGIWVLQNYPVMVTENCWKNAFSQKKHWIFPSYVVKYRRKNPTNFKIFEIFRRRRWNWSEYSISAVRKLFRQPDTLVQRHPSLLTEFTIRPCNSAVSARAATVATERYSTYCTACCGQALEQRKYRLKEEIGEYENK